MYLLYCSSGEMECSPEGWPTRIRKLADFSMFLAAISKESILLQFKRGFVKYTALKERNFSKKTVWRL